MSRLDGNSILIIDGDKHLSQTLHDNLAARGAIVFSVDSIEGALNTIEEFEVDVVISSYYLPDGLIHHVIDWCRYNLDQLPIFVALGTSVPGDDELMKRHLISGVFSKAIDMDKLVKSLQGYLFDFEKFYESLVSMIEPRGVALELVIQDEKMQVFPIEMTEEGIFVAVDRRFEFGTFGLLRVSVFDDDLLENYTMVGSMDGVINGGQHFRINESYESTWNKLLNKLNQRQLSITNFLCKVADK